MDACSTLQQRTQLSHKRHPSSTEVLPNSHFLEENRDPTKHHGDAISDEERACNQAALRVMIVEELSNTGTGVRQSDIRRASCFNSSIWSTTQSECTAIGVRRCIHRQKLIARGY